MAPHATDRVGVRELKSRLSACLRRVRRGASITVTDRGKAIALLSPADAPVERPGWALEMVAEGRATWSGGKPSGLRPRLLAKGRPASEMVIEDRR